ncbi:MAG: peptidase, partial [Phycisphaerales bacterium]
MLDDLVVLIDPLMNPDGRDRCVTLIRQHKMANPDVDDQSITHTQLWPSGRMNHYLFDLNRDWIFATQPETRGRVEAVAKWNPQYFMESHEMGGQDTFLFMPAREPVNNNYPGHSRKWGEIISHEHAAAFDALGWRYYSGEWNESWYPGYSSSWGALRGAIEQLYEQANIGTDALRRAEGTLQTYRESVHHQAVSSWSNLESCAKHRVEILRDFVKERRANLAPDGRFAKRVYAIPPSANRDRVAKVLDLALLQGFDVYAAPADFSAGGTDRFGREVKGRVFPAGTILIPASQPLGNLVSAMLEFDPRFSDAFLTEERRELIRFDRSRLYDTTAWNITMLFDVECCELAAELPAGAVRLDKAPAESARAINTIGTPVAYVIEGDDDRSVSVAARLMERGVWVRYAEKPFTFDGVARPRGSVLVVAKDNLNFEGDLAAAVREVANERGIAAFPVNGGLGDGDLPDLGGGYFQLLQPPRIAVVSQSPTEPYSYGEVWHMLDRRLGVRSSALDGQQLGAIDLRRYNVLVVHDGPGYADLTSHLPALRTWVESGGTLIAIGSAAAALAREGGIGATRDYSEVLGKLDDYRMAMIREWEGLTQTPDPAAAWGRVVKPV